MPDPLAMLAIINEHRPDLEKALGAQAPMFFSRLSELYMQARLSAGDPGTQQEVAAALLALVTQYPEASHLLHGVAPTIFPAPASTQSRPQPEPAAEAAPESAPLNFGPPLPRADFRRSLDPLLPDRLAGDAAARSLDPSLGSGTGLEAAGGTGTGGSTGTGSGAATAPLPAAPIVQRYADVQAPAAVAPAGPFPVTVALTRQPPAHTPQAAALSVRVTDTATGATGAPPITVLLYATAFDISGPTSAQLHIYPDKDSETATFQLQPKAGITGEQQISITFLQGGINILGRVVAKVQVGVPVDLTRGYSIPVGAGGASAGSGASDPDVVLWVDRLVQNDRDYLHFRYMWPQQNKRDPVDADPPVPLNQVEQYAANLYQQLSDCARYAAPPGAATDPGVQAANDAAERVLKRIGASLYEQLFPPALKAFYKQFAPTARTILIYSTEPWIPWEIVLPNDPDLADRDCEFLCARFQVTRWLIMDQDTPAAPRGVPSAVRVQQVCPIIPPVGLAATQDESSYLQSLPQKWPPLALYSPPPRTASGVLAAMQLGSINLFHIATHGQFNRQNPGAAGILFSSDGSQLTPDDIFEPVVRRGLTASSPLVFINACYSGQQGLALTGLGGWVDKLLRYGCSGFLGSNWEVQDDLAAQFAIAFYEGLRHGKTFGEACLLARTQIRAANRGNSTWLAYVLYAHPCGTLQVGPAAAPPGT